MPQQAQLEKSPSNTLGGSLGSVPILSPCWLGIYQATSGCWPPSQGSSFRSFCPLRPPVCFLGLVVKVPAEHAIVWGLVVSKYSSPERAHRSGPPPSTPRLLAVSSRSCLAPPDQGKCHRAEEGRHHWRLPAHTFPLGLIAALLDVRDEGGRLCSESFSDSCAEQNRKGGCKVGGYCRATPLAEG